MCVFHQAWQQARQLGQWFFESSTEHTKHGKQWLSLLTTTEVDVSPCSWCLGVLFLSHRSPISSFFLLQFLNRAPHLLRILGVTHISMSVVGHITAHYNKLVKNRRGELPSRTIPAPWSCCYRAFCSPQPDSPSFDPPYSSGMCAFTYSFFTSRIFSLRLTRSLLHRSI